MEPKDYKAELRKKAVQLIDRMPDRLDPLDKETIQNLFHELQVHQVELEIQNEELRNIQSTLEANRVRYASLFDNAPVGYVILDQFGIIKQFNSSFSRMIEESGNLKRRLPFADLLSRDSASAFRARYKAFCKNPSGKTMQVRLGSEDNGYRELLLETSAHTHLYGDLDNTCDELLISVTDITEITQTKKDLEQSLILARERENELNAFLEGARVVLEQPDFEAAAKEVFRICAELIGCKSGYVALLSGNGEENDVLFLEDGGLPCTVDPDLPMPVRGLREQAYATNSTVYENDFQGSEWTKFIPEGHVTLENVLFAPLVMYNRTVGIIGLANKAGGFTDHDAQLAHGFGELTAIGLRNSRNLDLRDKTEKKNRELIEELQQALANIKQLKGLVPICAKCKKIRDDKGYWNILESYIESHSNAEFSHGLCPECSDELYGDKDWFSQAAENTRDSD